MLIITTNYIEHLFPYNPSKPPALILLSCLAATIGAVPVHLSRAHPFMSRWKVARPLSSCWLKKYERRCFGCDFLLFCWSFWHGPSLSLLLQIVTMQRCSAIFVTSIPMATAEDLSLNSQQFLGPFFLFFEDLILPSSWWSSAGGRGLALTTVTRFRSPSTFNTRTFKEESNRKTSSWVMLQLHTHVYF